MAEIKLTADQVGRFNAEGELPTYPALDCFGKPYERRLVSMRSLSNGMFVVMPPDVDAHDLTFSGFGAQAEPPRAGKPAVKAEGDSK